MLFLESYSCIKFNSISGCGQDATRVCDLIFLKTMCICKQACAALFSDSAYQFEYFSAMLLLSLQVNASGQFCGVAEMAGDTADTAQLPNGFSIVFMCVLKTTLYSVSNSSLDIVLR
jgi:hypothetical protein